MNSVSIEKQKMIETLPEELTNKIIDYIEYLKFEYASNKAPEHLIIKNKEDLVKKLEEGIKEVETGKVCTLEQAFSDLQEIFND